MKLGPHQVTFLAEDLGKRNPPPLRYLAVLARHPSAVVREGAVYGMAPHIEISSVRGMLKDIAVRDPSPGVREAAREALDAEGVGVRQEDYHPRGTAPDRSDHSICHNCGDRFDAPERPCPNPSPGTPYVDCGRGGHYFICREQRASSITCSEFVHEQTMGPPRRGPGGA